DAEDQVAVAELVPAVAAPKGGIVALGEQLIACRCTKDIEMGRVGLVQPGEQAVDRPQASLRRDDEIRPAFAGSDGAVRRGHCLADADALSARAGRRAAPGS